MQDDITRFVFVINVRSAFNKRFNAVEITSQCGIMNNADAAKTGTIGKIKIPAFEHLFKTFNSAFTESPYSVCRLLLTVRNAL